MAELKWPVEIAGQAKKASKVLPFQAHEAFRKLISDLQNGPEAYGWHNYSQIHTQSYHCHLKKGKADICGFLESK